MPNQRSKDKIFLGGFVDKKLHARLVKLAKASGMETNKFGFAAQLIEEALGRRKVKKVAKAKPAPKAKRRSAKAR